jgi:uracil phosphoribosyltransferase
MVICSILRAGFPMHTVLNYFDAAQNGFISAYHPNNDDHFVGGDTKLTLNNDIYYY